MSTKKYNTSLRDFDELIAQRTWLQNGINEIENIANEITQS